MSDCISREAVLEHYRVTDPAGTFAYCDSILDFVSNLPAADVRPVVRGKWIEHGRYRPPTCSNCGSGALLNYESDYHKSDFCPHCGADMREKGEAHQ